MGDWSLRRATATDLEALVELRAVVMRPDLERLGRFDEDRVRQRLRDGFVPANSWVIEVGGELAGCVALRPDDDGHWLEHFYLSPAFQGQGVGSAVLDHLLAQCGLVRLIVLQGSSARRLYERHGFTVDSEDPVDVRMIREPHSAE